MLEEEVIPFNIAPGQRLGVSVPAIDAEQVEVYLQVASAAGLVYLFDNDVRVTDAPGYISSGNESFTLVAGGGGEPACRLRGGGNHRITLYADAANAGNAIGFLKYRAARFIPLHQIVPAEFREDRLPRRSPENATTPPPLPGGDSANPSPMHHPSGRSTY